MSPRTRLLRLAAAAIAGAVAAVVVQPARGDGAMSILYDLDPHVREIVEGAPGSPGLGPARGAHRQEGSSGHLFGGDGDAAYRLGKVPAEELEGLSAGEIAALLKRRVSDDGCVINGNDYGCRSHLVTVDEIGRRFNDRVGTLGRRLNQAMAQLQTPSPWGGTYASRVHFFVAPALTSQLAAARGRHENLGRDGKPHFPRWSNAIAAMARGGGVWLEMYHAKGGVRRPFSAGEWQRGPRDYLTLHTRAGGSPATVHFLMTGSPSSPPGRLPACSGPMSCTWALASQGVNATILANGAGVYRVGDQAAQWLREHNARFPG